MAMTVNTLYTDGTRMEVTSIYNGPTPVGLRVLHPADPTPHQPHRFLYIPAVENGIESTWGNGFDVIAASGLPDVLNLTLVAPEFGPITSDHSDHYYDSWLASDPNDTDRRYDVFYPNDLKPWVLANLSLEANEEHWAISFSKGGAGLFPMMAKFPTLFDFIAIFDLVTLDAVVTNIVNNFYGSWATINYGTQANYLDNYSIEQNHGTWLASMSTYPRIWIGRGSFFTADTDVLNQWMAAAGIPKHYDLSTDGFSHTWTSGWVPYGLWGLYHLSQAKRYPAPTSLPGTPVANLEFGCVFNDPTAVTHTTTFATTENPLSESGQWENGQDVGIDWTNVAVSGGVAYGTQTGASSPPYDDSVALLTGTWGAQQYARAKIVTTNRQSGSIFEEVELRLRSTLSANSCTGYEVNVGLNTSAYMQIVRWNGPLGDFTLLDAQSITVEDGDVFEATAIGDVITAYLNSVQILQVTDATYSAGNPGIGFYLQGATGLNSDFGLTEFSATGYDTQVAPLVASSGLSTATLPAGSSWEETFSGSGVRSVHIDHTGDGLNFGTGYHGSDLVDKTIIFWGKIHQSIRCILVTKDFDDGTPGDYGGYSLVYEIGGGASSNRLAWWIGPSAYVFDDGPYAFLSYVYQCHAITWDAATKTVKFYMHGRLNSTQVVTGPDEQASGSAMFLVGAYRSNTLAPTGTLLGNAQHVQVYNRKLTDDEIALAFAQPYNAYGQAATSAKHRGFFAA